MKNIVVALVITVTIISTLAAIGGANAQTSTDYIFRNGYYWKDNVAHTRTRVYLPVEFYTDSYGVKYARHQQYYWKYTVAQVTPATAPYAPNWRTQHTAVMQSLAQRSTDAKLLATDHAAYLASLKIIQQSMIPQPGEAGYGLFSSAMPFQGTTAYGPSAYGNYTVNAVAQRYAGEIDLNVFLTSITRLNDRALSGGLELTKNTQELAASIADAQARIVAARGPSVSATASATGVGARARIGLAPTSDTNLPGGTGGGATPAIAGATESLLAAKAVTDVKCLSCHSGTKAKGSLDLTNIALLTPEQWRGVILRTHTADAKLHMPPVGSPQLTADDELKLRNTGK